MTALGVPVAALVGILIGAWLWSEWIAGHRLGFAVAIAMLGAGVMVGGVGFGWWWFCGALLCGGWAAIGGSSRAGPEVAEHIATMPIASVHRWLILLNELRNAPTRMLRGVIPVRFHTPASQVLPTSEWVTLVGSPARLQMLAGRFLGLGLDSEAAAWASQLRSRCAPFVDLSTPVPLLEDPAVVALGVCRTLACAADQIVLVDPFSSVDGKTRTLLRRVISAEKERRSILVVDTTSSIPAPPPRR